MVAQQDENDKLKKSGEPEEEALRKEWEEKIFPRDYFHNVNEAIVEQLFKATQGNGPFPQNNKFSNLEKAFYVLSRMTRQQLTEERAKEPHISAISKYGLFGPQQVKENNLPKKPGKDNKNKLSK